MIAILITADGLISHEVIQDARMSIIRSAKMRIRPNEPGEPRMPQPRRYDYKGRVGEIIIYEEDND